MGDVASLPLWRPSVSEIRSTVGTCTGLFSDQLRALAQSVLSSEQWSGITTIAHLDPLDVAAVAGFDDTIEGPSIDLGAEEKYFPACYACYTAQIESAQRLAAEASAARTIPV